MSRTVTMARFPEPDEPRPIGVCIECGEYLQENQEVFEYDGNHTCDGDCMHDYLLKQGVITCKDLQKEDVM